MWSMRRFACSDSHISAEAPITSRRSPEFTEANSSVGRQIPTIYRHSQGHENVHQPDAVTSDSAGLSEISPARGRRVHVVISPHILAAYRLFTFQRRLASEEAGDTTPVRPPRWSITCGFPQLSSTSGYVRSHYSPLRHCPRAEARFSFNLHALAMPPAFNLSQDQTL